MAKRKAGALTKSESDRLVAIREYEDSGMLQITKMIPILGWGNFGEDLREFIEDHTYEEFVEYLGVKGSDYLEEMFEEGHNEGIGEWLTERYHGKLIVFAKTPVMDGNMFSWGYCRLNYYMADDLTDAIRKGLEWVKEEEKKSKKKKKVKK